MESNKWAKTKTTTPRQSDMSSSWERSEFVSNNVFFDNADMFVRRLGHVVNFVARLKCCCCCHYYFGVMMKQVRRGPLPLLFPHRHSRHRQPYFSKTSPCLVVVVVVVVATAVGWWWFLMVGVDGERLVTIR